MNNDLVVPDDVDLEYLLDELRKLSWKSADILMAYAHGEKPPYGLPESLTVEEGGDGPVSAADIAVNELFISGLNEKFSTIQWEILSEESAKQKTNETREIKKDWKWILDPLDGTKDFLQGSENYAVHLALSYKNKTKLGIVLIPERNELWFGISDNGAWYENRKGVRNPVSFSNRRETSELILVSSKNHQELRLKNLLKELNFAETRNMGSVGCKVASILRGESDVYISLSGKTSPKDWDIAAPQALIQAAGGEFTHADGRSLSFEEPDYSQRGCLIASHGISHEKICQKTMSFFCEKEAEYIV